MIIFEQQGDHLGIIVQIRFDVKEVLFSKKNLCINTLSYVLNQKINFVLHCLRLEDLKQYRQVDMMPTFCTVLSILSIGHFEQREFFTQRIYNFSINCFSNFNGHETHEIVI